MECAYFCFFEGKGSQTAEKNIHTVDSNSILIFSFPESNKLYNITIKYTKSKEKRIYKKHFAKANSAEI